MKYRAFTEHETIAEAATMNDCLKGILEDCTLEDIIEWNIWIEVIDEDGNETESFASTAVYDMCKELE